MDTSPLFNQIEALIFESSLEKASRFSAEIDHEGNVEYKYKLSNLSDDLLHHRLIDIHHVTNTMQLK